MNDPLSPGAIADDEMEAAGLFVEDDSHADTCTCAECIGRRVGGKGRPWRKPGWPDPLHPAAFHGLAGEVVRTIEPHTEADPAALLVQFLVAFGNCVNRGPHAKVGATSHRPNLFVVIVGDSSSGRKGTGYDAAVYPVAQSDPSWYRSCKFSGLSTGEGLIHRVRDATHKTDKRGDLVVADEGVEDKRLLIVETEFGKPLEVAAREGNPLSAVIRQAWDGGTLEVGTKTAPAKATDPHISLIGHITKADIVRRLSDTDIANGFANRFLWIASKRTKELPDGGFPPSEELQSLVAQTHRAFDKARRVSELRRDPEAAELWRSIYGQAASKMPGTFGDVTRRAEAQMLRLSVLYALLDGSREIRREHLLAAIAVWDYAAASALWLFGDSLGDRDADTLLDELRNSWPFELSRTELRNLLSRNRPVGPPLENLADLGLAESRRVINDGGGRPAEYWKATEAQGVGVKSLMAYVSSTETFSGGEDKPGHIYTNQKPPPPSYARDFTEQTYAVNDKTPEHLPEHPEGCRCDVCLFGW